MTNPPAVLFTRDANVARLTFNRPDVLNAIDIETARMFRDACHAIASDPDVRVVVMQGAGRGFVAGGDLKVFEAGPADIAASLIDPMHEGLALLTAADAPVVARLHGAVAGAGMSLALGCDLAIAAEGTRFNMAYLRVGASCDVGASWHLPRIVGLRRAMEIALLNPVLDAEEAHRIGLVNRVVPADALDATVDMIVAQLVAGPPVATGLMKRLLRQSAEHDLAQQLASERDSFDICAATADFSEALVAFTERRPARYTGR